MKHKFLLLAIVLLLLVPASFAQQTFNMWTQNDHIDGTGKVCTFDIYAQSTCGADIIVYSYQMCFSYATASKGTGTITAAWSNINAALTTGGETPKATNCTQTPYIKLGFNVSPGGSGTGVAMPVAAPFKIGTLTVTNTVAWVGLPLFTWSYLGLPTKVQATNGTSGYDITSYGTFSYLAPTGIALPVELSSFASAVQGRTIVLNWSTKTEKNSNVFQIERSLVSNGTWSTVASVKAADLSNSPKSYSYSDTKLQSGKYQYRLKMVDNDGQFSYSAVEAAEVAIPKDFQVSQNYPNPFNPSTKIDYQVPVDAKVILEVYNIAGQKVVELVNQTMSAGYYTVDFGGSKLSSGIYIYRLAAVDATTGNNFSSIKKMMLLK
jgi:hypothetical protein